LVKIFDFSYKSQNQPFELQLINLIFTLLKNETLEFLVTTGAGESVTLYLTLFHNCNLFDL